MVSICLRGVTKRFADTVAVDNVDLTIEEGELFFLLGPSGCGKTTILRIIAGFYSPDEGGILFDNRDISAVPPHKRNTGMVFQNYALWPHMTVYKNVEYGLNMRDVSKANKETRVQRALEIVEMERYRERSPNQLSGGQQQRVALARALVVEPDAVLMDEPLSNLDAKLRIEMRERIKRIHQELGVTMVYVTHDQTEALCMADRMAVMDMGKVVQVAPPREIYARPKSVFVAGFIGETNFIKGKVSQRTSAPGPQQGIFVDTTVGKIVSSIHNEICSEIGEEVTCSIRPELIVVSGDRAESDVNGSATPNKLSGKVESVLYMGDNEQYFVRLNDGTLLKAVEHKPAEQKALSGQNANLSFDPKDVIILKE